MKTLLIFLFSIIISFSYSQETINVKLLDSIPLKADSFIGTDDFENYYYLISNTIYKKTPIKVYSYTNTALGTIASVDITNPLKILLFYRNFNTIVILDNRLNELTDIINLNLESYGKNAAFANISSNNNLWLFSLDDNVLSLWNYETKKTVFNSQPLSFYKKDFEIVSQISNYKYCWLTSKESVLIFNEFGSYINAINMAGLSNITPYLNDIVYLINNNIYLYQDEIAKKIKDVNKYHFSTNYFVNKNYLYFFSSNTIYKYYILKK